MYWFVRQRGLKLGAKVWERELHICCTKSNNYLAGDASADYLINTLSSVFPLYLP